MLSALSLEAEFTSNGQEGIIHQVPNTEITPEYYGFGSEVLSQDFEDVGGEERLAHGKVIDWSTGEIAVEATAAAFNARVVIAPLWAYGLLGKEKSRWVIRVDENLRPLHQTFVVGHEIGHIVLYEYAYREGYIKDFEEGYSRDKEVRRHVEALCDYFGGKLLGLDYPQHIDEPEIQTSQLVLF